MPASGLRPVSMMVAPMPWSSFWLLRPRTIASRWACLAVCGKSSLMCVPETEVGMALNGPPVSVFGFGSHDSSWLKPPERKITITRFCDRASAALASEDAKPSGPSAAAALAVPRNARRETACSAVLQA